MIDLREKALPNTIMVGGVPYSIKTDFRTWIQFAEVTKNEVYLKDLFFIFAGAIPLQDFSEEAYAFFVNYNATPKLEGAGKQIYDYVLDGEYIYASFMQVYGIDLLETDMHWHKFKALFVSLPAECKMGQIMADRAYEKTTRKYEDVMEERKRMWTLPEVIDEEIIEGLYNDFYGAL